MPESRSAPVAYYRAELFTLLPSADKKDFIITVKANGIEHRFAIAPQVLMDAIGVLAKKHPEAKRKG